MKGSPQIPSCGFSARAAQALLSTGEKFAFVNVLADPDIMTYLPEYADWPTFPQIYLSGELIGGSDIVIEMAEKDELKAVLEEANSQQQD
jgi:monothiol glutaredoxin